MRRFMQGCAITALVLIVLGFSMALIAGGVKGTETIENVVESVTKGKVQVNLDGISDWGISVGETVGAAVGDMGVNIGDIGSTIGDGVGDAIGDGIAEGLDNVHYDLDDAMVFDKKHEILKGDVDKFSVGNEVGELFVEVGGCVFTMKESGDDNYYLEAENTKKFQGYVEDGTLFVRATIGTGTVTKGKECRVTLYVPDNWKEKRLEKVDMELGAGVMDLSGFDAEKVLLEVGAGQITLSEVVAETLDVSVGMGEIVVEALTVDKLLGEVGMGRLYLEGAIYDKADVECAMGSLEMVVQGSQDDFDYDVECGMGNITLGGDSYGGVAQEKTIDNGASKKMLVECAMGDVNIAFTE